MSPLLLDTCAAIWFATGDLGETAIDLLRSTRRSGALLMVSPITGWEIGLLNSRGRLPLLYEPAVWFRKLMDLPGLALAPMTPDILIASSFLPGTPPRDPADRIIAATARALGYRLVTRDRLLLDYAGAGHVEAVAC